MNPSLQFTIAKHDLNIVKDSLWVDWLALFSSSFALQNKTIRR